MELFRVASLSVGPSERRVLGVPFSSRMKMCRMFRSVAATEGGVASVPVSHNEVVLSLCKAWHHCPSLLMKEACELMLFVPAWPLPRSITVMKVCPLYQSVRVKRAWPVCVCVRRPKFIEGGVTLVSVSSGKEVVTLVSVRLSKWGVLISSFGTVKEAWPYDCWKKATPPFVNHNKLSVTCFVQSQWKEVWPRRLSVIIRTTCTNV